jgi:hypothetical protein
MDKTTSDMIDLSNDWPFCVYLPLWRISSLINKSAQCIVPIMQELVGVRMTEIFPPFRTFEGVQVTIGTSRKTVHWCLTTLWPPYNRFLWNIDLARSLLNVGQVLRGGLIGRCLPHSESCPGHVFLSRHTIFFAFVV